MRTAEIDRRTAETDICVRLNLDGTGKNQIDTGIGFLDHMLCLFSHHGGFDLDVACKGDTWVDGHHTTEDIGIALGEAFKAALGAKEGIKRYGSMLLPMDEALVLCAVDLSGRCMVRWNMELPCEKVGTFDTELGEEFFWGFARACAATVHMRQLDGENTHHILEAAFKAFGHAMKEAVALDAALEGRLLSTKGVL